MADSEKKEIKDLRDANGHFLPGNTVAALGAGVPKLEGVFRHSVMKLSKIGALDELKEQVLQNWMELLNSEKEAIRMTATKEIMKYIFPAKSEVKETTDSNVTVIFDNGTEPSSLGFSNEKVKELQKAVIDNLQDS